jgi:hypothetical protein
MKISILNVQEIIFQGVVSEAILPGADGELSIMDDHEPIFVVLNQGFIRLVSLAKKMGFGFGGSRQQATLQDLKPVKIHRGVARMFNNELVILVE